jgi:hypothetical protein
MKKKTTDSHNQEKAFIKQENFFIEELTRDDPEKLILTQLGTVMQDYIDAYISFTSQSSYEKYISHLLYVMVKRLNKNSKTIN